MDIVKTLKLEADEDLIPKVLDSLGDYFEGGSGIIFGFYFASGEDLKTDYDLNIYVFPEYINFKANYTIRAEESSLKDIKTVIMDYLRQQEQ